MKKNFNKTLPLFLERMIKMLINLLISNVTLTNLLLVWSKHLREKTKFSKYIFRNK